MNEQRNIMCQRLGAANFSFGDLLAEFLPILINALIRCFDPDDGEQAQEYVVKRYDPEKWPEKYGGYKRGMIRAAARQAKQTARQDKRKITWSQARELAIAVCDDVRTADRQHLSLVIREAD